MEGMKLAGLVLFGWMAMAADQPSYQDVRKALDANSSLLGALVTAAAGE